MNSPLEQPDNKRNREEIDAEIERMAREQGVKPFDPDEPFEGDFWSDEEFAEFEKQIRESRREPEREEWL